MRAACSVPGILVRLGAGLGQVGPQTIHGAGSASSKIDPVVLPADAQRGLHAGPVEGVGLVGKGVQRLEHVRVGVHDLGAPQRGAELPEVLARARGADLLAPRGVAPPHAGALDADDAAHAIAHRKAWSAPWLHAWASELRLGARAVRAAAVLRAPGEIRGAEKLLELLVMRRVQVDHLMEVVGLVVALIEPVVRNALQPCRTSMLWGLVSLKLLVLQSRDDSPGRQPMPEPDDVYAAADAEPHQNSAPSQDHRMSTSINVAV
mmetsp:Transcript_86317/g.252571  ORF Transcript_86317/g.252571 Transcript_86317/m.252571 type:complete len:263 (+) Transcript_86317:1173-1961(+)